MKTLFLATSIALLAALPTAHARPDSFPDILAAVTFGTGERINGSGRIVDLGPEGGAGGGRVIAQCPPEELRTTSTPTGRELEQFLTRPPVGA